MIGSVVPIITIDGPGGVGKGTVSLLIASELKWDLLDSGAIYRTFAYHATNQKVDLQDEEALSKLAVSLPIRFVKGKQGFPSLEIYLDNHLVTDEIRSESCGIIASKIAKFPKIREILLSLQRSFAKVPGLVADGRDMGTVVFPEAKLKFFLEASVEERAKRRYMQLKANGVDVNLSIITKEIAIRDKQDRERAVSPMKPAIGAIIIDTTRMSIEDVFAEVMKHIKKV
jgi:cytidylate kinase